MTPERPLRTADFEYDLPPELIAQRPAGERGTSRLLVLHRAGSSPSSHRPIAPSSAFHDLCFRDLAELIPPGDLLVLNTTRVRHARLVGRRASGGEGAAEVLLIRPAPGGLWVAMGKPGRAFRPGRRIEVGPGAWVETVEVLEDGNRLVRFPGLSAEETVARFGRLPLPPYIARPAEPADDERYQTVYADREGSVAAPTAGLHFTPALLDRLEGSGVRIERLDLEVGPGTFKPVEEEDPSRHRMHPERYEIPDGLVNAIREVRGSGGAVWAVGTTVVRALEAAAAGSGQVRAGPGETAIFIRPGHLFQVVDRVVTNFHLPRSTLLMLVAAFAGLELTLAAYRHAIAQRYRFYSYGDAMAIL